MLRRSANRVLALGCLCLASAGAVDVGGEVGSMVEQFAAEVNRRLEVPADARAAYIALLANELRASGAVLDRPQHVLLVDRSANVQAIMLVLFEPPGRWHWIGASAVSTGRPGSFDHFLTPTGVFAHSLDNPDFRAEGTYNDNHIRGYGLRGMRVFDFGWVASERGWGAGGTSDMRLQMHATDPTTLEPRLGTAQSKGCIRISAALNRYLDHRGVLDLDYEQAVQGGKRLWVLSEQREPARWPGRYLVVVDSRAAERPAWSPLPAKAPP